jgi:hypothetical protein
MDANIDSAIDRFRARARFVAALTLLALMGGMMFAGSLTALMRPLVTAVEQVRQPARSRQ